MPADVRNWAPGVVVDFGEAGEGSAVSRLEFRGSGSGFSRPESAVVTEQIIVCLLCWVGSAGADSAE